MPQKPLPYEVIENPADLQPADIALLERAEQALDHSYSPYSGFKVAAAVLLESGQIITGFNIENASYPVCLCAEQTTISAVRTQHPGTRLKAMAIRVRNRSNPVNQPATPCGQCRQLLFEQEQVNGAPVRLILQGESGPIWIFDSLSLLLPFGFTGELL